MTTRKPGVGAIEALVERLGVEQRIGSSLNVGVPYQPIPYQELSYLECQRPMAWLDCLTVLRAAQKRFGLFETYREPNADRGAELRVLDLGANVGLFSIIFARFGAKVTAVESDPANANVLKALVKYERLDGKVTVIQGSAIKDYGVFDLTLCLNLHHWIYRQSGPEVTDRFVRQILRNTTALAFQTAHAGSHGAYTLPFLTSQAAVGQYLRRHGAKSSRVLDQSGYKNPRWTLWAETERADAEIE